MAPPVSVRTCLQYKRSQCIVAELLPFRKTNVRSRSWITSADTEDSDYLRAVETAIAALVDFSPSLVIYQAGVDPLRKDRLGKMNISRGGLQQRNTFVFDCVDALHLPCLVLMGGGYAEPIEPTVECLSDLFLEAARRHYTRQEAHATF